MNKKILLLITLITSIFSLQDIYAQGVTPFKYVWDATDGQITIPAEGDYIYSCQHISIPTMTFAGVSSGFNNFTLPSFLDSGMYVVSLTPTGSTPLHRVKFSSSSLPKDGLISILDWGSVQWSTMENMFYQCLNFSIDAPNAPDLSIATSMKNMFFNCYNFNSNINHWNVSNITNMHGTFGVASAFNQPLNNWDVSNVNTFFGMFFNASSFNQPLHNWDVTAATNMSSMFANATIFNQPLNDWDVSNVDSTVSIFAYAYAFNQPLDNWDISNVRCGDYMFNHARNYNQPLDSWDVSNIKSMKGMFSHAYAFDQPLGSWDVSNVTSMYEMFKNATSFNQSLNNWDVSNVTTMQEMLRGATAYNQPSYNWTLSSLINARNLFTGTALDCNHNSQNLIGWAANSATADNVLYTYVTSGYGTGAVTPLAELVTKGWNINMLPGTAGHLPSCVITPLSVTLVKFTADKINDKASLLEWTTTSEQNNHTFEVERSADGKTWKKIGVVKSKTEDGNSTSPLDYQFVDNAPISGLNLYRLRQLDFDGAFYLSDVQKLDFDTGSSISIYPNPVNDFINIARLNGSETITIINMIGQVVRTTFANKALVQISLEGLPEGMYNVVIRDLNNHHIQTRKFVKF